MCGIRGSQNRLKFIPEMHNDVLGIRKNFQLDPTYISGTLPMLKVKKSLRVETEKSWKFFN
jgi:hypothetical protein